MANNFFKVKNGISLPTLAADPTTNPPANSETGDAAFYNNELYIKTAAAWEKVIAGQAESTEIKDSAVTTAKIANGAVTTDKITDLNVTTDKIANSAVTTTKIADSNITNAKIANSAVTTVKITDSSVTTAKIADSNVTTVKIADSAVTTAKISNSSVTTDKIADLNVTTGKIASSAVTDVKLATNAVTADKIASNAVTEAKISSGAVTNAKLATSAVTDTKIASSAVTNAKLASNAVTDVKVDANAAIAGSKISPNFGAQNIQTTGNTTVGGITKLDGQILMGSPQGYIRDYASGFSSTHTPTTPHEIGRIILAGPSLNISIVGEIRATSGQANSTTRFIINIRSNTLPAKGFTFSEEVINLGREIRVKLYEDITSGLVVIGYQGSNDIQNIGWSLKIQERGNYNYFQQVQGLTPLDTTGLSEIAPTSSSRTIYNQNLTVEGTVSGTAFLGNAVGASGDTSMKNIYGYARIQSPFQTATALQPSQTIDCSLKNIELKIGGTTSTITLSNFAEGQTFVLVVLGNGSPYTLSWTDVKWPSAVVPIPTSTINRFDVYSFIKIGGFIFGSVTKDLG